MIAQHLHKVESIQGVKVANKKKRKEIKTTQTHSTSKNRKKAE